MSIQQQYWIGKSVQLQGPIRFSGLGKSHNFLGGPKLGQEELNTIIDEIGTIIGKLPDEIGDPLREKLNQCKIASSEAGVVGIFEAYKCFKDLVEKARAALKGRKEITVTPPTFTPTVEPPASPLLPILGGIAAAGIVGYFVLKG